VEEFPPSAEVVAMVTTRELQLGGRPSCILEHKGGHGIVNAQQVRSLVSASLLLHYMFVMLLRSIYWMMHSRRIESRSRQFVLVEVMAGFAIGLRFLRGAWRCGLDGGGRGCAKRFCVHV
jgi:hypothetical protein